jgi:hypothetical protein
VSRGEHPDYKLRYVDGVDNAIQMAWQMGHPLSQTLFTSIYIDRLLWPEPKELAQATFSRVEGDSRGGPWVHTVLRSYCLGMVKCCDFVHIRVASEQFYEVNHPKLLVFLELLIIRSVEVMACSHDIRRKTS